MVSNLQPPPSLQDIRDKGGVILLPPPLPPALAKRAYQPKAISSSSGLPTRRQKNDIWLGVKLILLLRELRHNQIQIFKLQFFLAFILWQEHGNTVPCAHFSSSSSSSSSSSRLPYTEWQKKRGAHLNKSYGGHPLWSSSMNLHPSFSSVFFSFIFFLSLSWMQSKTGTEPVQGKYCMLVIIEKSKKLQDKSPKKLKMEEKLVCLIKKKPRLPPIFFLLTSCWD